MQPRTRALFWEAIARSRKDFLIRLGVASCIAIIASILLASWGSRGSSEQSVLKGCTLLVLLEISIASSVWWKGIDPDAESPMRQMFCRPAATWQLVSIPMLCASLAAAICQFTSASILAVTVDGSFPVFASTVLAAAFAALPLAGGWAFSSLFGRMLGIAFAIATIIGLISLFQAGLAVEMSGQPFLVSIGQGGFFNGKWMAWSAVFAAVPIGFFVALRGISLQRCSELGWAESVAQALWRRAAGGQLSKSRANHVASEQPFRSKLAAQIWYEWEYSKRRIVTATSTIVVLTVIATSLSVLLNSESGLDALIWRGTLLLSPVILGLLVADAAAGVQGKQGAAVYSEFAATRSTTCSWSVVHKLCFVSVVTFICWSAVAMVAALHCMLYGWERLSVPALEFEQAVATNAVLVALTAAIALSMTFAVFILQTAYWMARFPRAWLALASAVYGHVVLLFILASKGWPYVEYWRVYFYCVAAVIVLVVASGLVLAVFSRQMSWRYLILGAVIFALDVCLASWLMNSRFSELLLQVLPKTARIPEQLSGIPLSLLWVLVLAGAIFTLPAVLGRLRHM